MKLKRIFTLLVGGIAVLCARGEVTENYTYGFNEKLDTDVKAFHPFGWLHSVDESYTSSPTYEWIEDGGRTGGCISGVQVQSSWSTYNDVLITPPITGSSSIYIKLKEDGGTVSFFSIGEPNPSYDSKYYVTNLNVNVPTLSKEEWTKVDIPAQNNARVGIRLDNVYADDFEAAACDVFAYENLEITQAKMLNDYKVAGDAENKFDIQYELTLKNKGDVAYSPGDIVLSHFIYKNSSEPYIEGSLAEYAIEEELGVGETKTFNITVSLKVDERPFTSYYVRVKENVTGHDKELNSTITFTPYVPEMKLYNPDTSSEYSSANTTWGAPYNPHLTFGAIYTDSMREVKASVKNVAPKAPLKITDIQVSDANFTLSEFEGPVTVNAGETYDFSVYFNETNPGVYRSDLTISAEGLDDMVIYLSAAVPDPTTWSEGFEEGVIPAGYISEGNWNISDMPSSYSETGHKKVLFAEYSTCKLVTPKLRVKENECLLISGFAYRYQDMDLKVAYSTDRSNWIQIYATSTADVKNKFSTNLGPNDLKYRSFISIDNIPAGDYFLKFEGSRMEIDEIYGFTKLEAGKDLYIKSSEIQNKGKVNYPLEGNVSVLNLGQALSADDYTVSLYLGDTLLSEATPVNLASGEEHSFLFSGVPHEYGEFEGSVKIVLEDNIITSAPTAILIQEEKETEDVILGPMSGYNSYGPIKLGYNQKSQAIYNPKVINDYGGITKDSKIESITYYGTYSSYYGSVEPFEADLTVYMKNVEDEKLTKDEANSSWSTYYYFTSENEMTKVYEGKVTVNPSSGGVLFTLDLDEKFTYDGNSIIIQTISSNAASSYDNLEFYANSTYSSGYYVYSSASTFPESASGSGSLPTVGLGVSADVAEVTGSVKHADTGEAIADVHVRVESDDNVSYHAVTDENGEYTIRVIQPSKLYKVKAVKEGHNPYESNEYLDLSELSATHHIMLGSTPTGIGITKDGSFKVRGINGGLLLSSDEVLDVKIFDTLGHIIDEIVNFSGSKRVNLAPGIYIVNNSKVIVR